MTTEAPFPPPTARPQCPRCGTPVPVTGAGTQIIRCGGCGAALQVNVRPLESPPRTPDAALPSSEEAGARPRRRPMVEVPGPRRVEPPPSTFTVELSQSDIETEGLDTSAPAKPPRPPPTPPPAPAQAPSVDTPWFAEDIERLPEVSASLGQLSLETFEPLPPLPLRPDVPVASRSPAGGQPRPSGARPIPSQEK